MFDSLEDIAHKMAYDGFPLRPVRVAATEEQEIQFVENFFRS